MFIYTNRFQSTLAFRMTASLVLIAFVTGFLVPVPKVQAQGVPDLPLPGVMLTATSAYAPPILKGMRVDLKDPFAFDFILDSGNADLTQEEMRQEASRLIKYFLASLTIPEDDLWVNLSPYEKDRIIPDEFGMTEMGRDFLAQDYVLKQLTASLIYPEEGMGKEFWGRVYSKAKQLYGTEEIPVNTFNKVWILPEKAVVYEGQGIVFVLESHLKVMMEEDYLALKAGDQANNEALNSISSQVIREVIIPELEREVNYGAHFAKLRQIYQSLILAKWYKQNLRQSILNREYADQKKVAGVGVDDASVKERIYAQYLEAFKKGVFNYIKEDYDSARNEVVPRQYFSGGLHFKISMEIVRDPQDLAKAEIAGKLSWIKGVYRQPRVSARFVNDYIGRQFQAGKVKKGDPIILEDGQETEVYVVDGLLKATGQFGHIGLGAKEQKEGKVVYKDNELPVVYLDGGYAANRALRDNERFKIGRWEGQKDLLGRQQGLGRPLTAGEMRQWIKDNIKEAAELLQIWDQEAPSLKLLFQEAYEKHLLPTNEDIAQTYSIETDFRDLNLAAGKITDGEENFSDEELEDFRKVVEGITVLVQEMENLVGGNKLKRKKEYQQKIAGLMRPLMRNARPIFSENVSDKIAKKRGLPTRLALFLELAVMRDGNQFVFNPSQIAKIIADYPLGEEGIVKDKIAWLRHQKSEDGEFWFKGSDIPAIVLSGRPFEETKKWILYLFEQRDEEGPLSGPQISRTVSNGASLEDKKKLFVSLWEQRDGGKRRFSNLVISEIIHVGVTAEEKDWIISLSERKDGEKRWFSNSDIRRLSLSGAKFEDKKKLFAYLWGQRDGRKHRFSGHQISWIIYGGANLDGKMKLISDLQAQRGEDGEFWFSGYDIARIVQRMQYFNRENFDKIKAIFEGTKASHGSIVSWALYPQEYSAMLKSWMSKPFEELTPKEQWRRRSLVFMASSKWGEKDIMDLAEIYLSAQDYQKFRQYVEKEVAEDHGRLNDLLRNSWSPSERDGMLRRLMVSYNKDIRDRTGIRIYDMLSSAILEASRKYGDDGGDVSWEYLSRYNWSRENAGLENLRRNLRVILKYKREYLGWLNMPDEIKKILQAIKRQRLKGLAEQQIDEFLINQRGYSPAEIADARNFKEISLDEPTGNKGQTFYDLIVGEQYGEVLRQADEESGELLEGFGMGDGAHYDEIYGDSGWEDVSHASSPVQKAMDVRNIGGIDFNLDLLELEIQGHGKDFNMPNPDRGFDYIRIDDGLLPVIMNMTPVTNFHLFLGTTGDGASPLALSKGQ